MKEDKTDENQWPFIACFIILALILLSTIFLKVVLFEGEKTYLVKVEFCDEMSPIETKIIWDYIVPPSRYNINTYNEAVPNFAGYINVCNVETIREIK